MTHVFSKFLLFAILQQAVPEDEFLRIATQLAGVLHVETVRQPPGTRLVIDVASLAAVGEQLTGKRVPDSAIVAAITPVGAPAPWDSVVDRTVRPWRLAHGVVAVRVDSATTGTVRFTKPVVKDVYVLQLYISIVVPREDPVREGPPCGFHMGVLYSRDDTGHWQLDRVRTIDMC